MTDHRPTDHDDLPRSLGLSRRQVLIGGLAVGALAIAPACDPTGTGAAAYPNQSKPASPCNFGYDWPKPPTEAHIRHIMFPVLPDPTLGGATWTDTYMAPRGSGGCRYHEGQDLMAKKLVKLLACTDGTIVSLRHQSGGNSLTIEDDDGYYYCYLHINDDDPGTTNGANQFRYAFAPGLAQGQRVKQGQHVAFVGDSGNASGTAPHCHFEIRVPNASQWKAAAVNPKFSLEKAIPAQQTS